MTMHFSTVTADLEVKDASGKGYIKGYASTFDNVDRGDDVVVKGAFAGLRNPKDVRLLWQHEQRKPIGVWDVLKEDEKGLYAEGRINLKSKTGEEAYELLKMGGIRDLSIGYRTLDAEDVKVGTRRVRKLKKLDLVEVSIVSVPMNPLARISDVKSVLVGDDDISVRTIERRLRDAGLPRGLARSLASVGRSGMDEYLMKAIQEAARVSSQEARLILDAGYRDFLDAKSSGGLSVVVDVDDDDWRPAEPVSEPAPTAQQAKSEPSIITICPTLLAAISADLDLA